MPIEASEVAILQGRRVGTPETGATQKWPAATRAGAAGQVTEGGVGRPQRPLSWLPSPRCQLSLQVHRSSA